MSKATKPSKLSVPKSRLPAGIPDVQKLKAEPLSGHAPWPLKYFRPMEDGLRRINDEGTSNLTGSNQEKFEQEFRNTPFKKTAYYKHMNTFLYAPIALRDYFRGLGYSDAATWERFRKRVLELYKGSDPDVYSRLTGGASGKGRANTTQRKAEPTTAAIHKADTWIATQKSPASHALVEVRSRSPSPEPAGSAVGVCDSCGGDTPERPSKLLQQLKAKLSDSDSDERLQLKFCELHNAESLREQYPVDMRWPETMDFSALGDRVVAFHAEIEAIWLKPSLGNFYAPYMERVNSLGTYAKAASIAGDRSCIGTGYFGDKGFIIIWNALQVLFDEETYTHEDELALDYQGFLWCIIAPEMLVMLVREDLPGISSEDATSIIKASGSYGYLMHPEDESEDGVELERAVVKRNSGKHEDAPPMHPVVKLEEDEVTEVIKDSACTVTTLIEDGREILVLDD
ncbi:hypothetical protein D9611_009053 [Ephemerocybe angulata]|uniref:Restriction of telomere capping protein 4 n=1 Tax=Ephemerocybe angulata TaxID=980116 RepID=A0A8H5CE06_9AGAR|nr:hypothetical protein D9611_009053 [Tulosesus angulatus]